MSKPAITDAYLEARYAYQYNLNHIVKQSSLKNEITDLAACVVTKADVYNLLEEGKKNQWFITQADAQRAEAILGKFQLVDENPELQKWVNDLFADALSNDSGDSKILKKIFDYGHRMQTQAKTIKFNPIPIVQKDLPDTFLEDSCSYSGTDFVVNMAWKVAMLGVVTGFAYLLYQNGLPSPFSSAADPSNPPLTVTKSENPKESVLGLKFNYQKPPVITAEDIKNAEKLKSESVRKKILNENNIWKKTALKGPSDALKKVPLKAHDTQQEKGAVSKNNSAVQIENITLPAEQSIWKNAFSIPSKEVLGDNVSVAVQAPVPEYEHAVNAFVEDVLKENPLSFEAKQTLSEYLYAICNSSIPQEVRDFITERVARVAALDPTKVVAGLGAAALGTGGIVYRKTVAAGALKTYTVMKEVTHGIISTGKYTVIGVAKGSVWAVKLVCGAVSGTFTYIHKNFIEDPKQIAREKHVKMILNRPR